MAPASTRPWPSRYLVAEWITRSAPSSIGRCSAGEHMQLSTASSAPASRAICASAAMSATSQTGFDGVSTKRRRVSRRTARFHASRSASSTHVVAMPRRARIWSKSGTTVPNTPRAATMWSPLFSRPSASRRDRRHARRRGDARLGALERGEAVLEHLHRGIGEARVDVARLFVGELARRFARRSCRRSSS